MLGASPPRGLSVQHSYLTILICFFAFCTIYEEYEKENYFQAKLYQVSNHIEIKLITTAAFHWLIKRIVMTLKPHKNAVT